jgi:signal transduction histidine kinase
VILAFLNEFIWNRKGTRRARRQEHERARQIQELARAQDDLKQLSVRLLTVQEDERKDLSRELHDGLGQLLTAVRMEITAVRSSSPAPNKDEYEPRIERAHLYLAEAIKTVRNIASLLRPTILDDLGLDAALRWHAEQFSQRTGIPCTLASQGFHKSLPDSWNTCVYRIVQEALHNCEKHARATRVQISIVHQPGMLSVDIEDNGQGFSQKSHSSGASSGLGLLGMRERAMMLGGALTIDSSLGRGTKVQLRLPTAEMSALKSDEYDENSIATV